MEKWAPVFVLLFVYSAAAAIGKPDKGLAEKPGKNPVENPDENLVENPDYRIFCKYTNIDHFTYQVKEDNSILDIRLPEFEIGGIKTPAIIRKWRLIGEVQLKNEVKEETFDGTFFNDPSLHLQIQFQVPPRGPVVRFKYLLKCMSALTLTKSTGQEAITYLSTRLPVLQVKEVRLSEFNERFHATHRTEDLLQQQYFADSASFMGPMAVFEKGKDHFLVAYEHGSQYPDRFLEYRLQKDGTMRVRSVKGNYLDKQEADGFNSVWFQVAGIKGEEDALAGDYRDFILRYFTQNAESRKPYIYYNTWGRQERTHWAGARYLSSMNLDYTLREIDRAHAMGIEVFVLDAGWFLKTGDWSVNTNFFPDTLKQVKARLDQYHMKLGLWFNPTVAAVSSQMFQHNLANRMSWNGQHEDAAEIWETEKSVSMCLVSSYWEDFANKLIGLTRQLGVSYFKWDGIGQYGCNDPHHFHGTEANTAQERSDRYAFLEPLYMSKIIDKVCKEAPQCIFDFDITESGRCVGLEYLSSGKYFIMNNGPYYDNYDLNPPFKNDAVNIFVEPGPARGWFVRSVLDYDKWIPSILFLTHYQPDEPRNSQIINLGSLILGQNGIWAEILKTSDSGVRLFDTVLTRYKQVREDITAAQMVQTGETGDSPEIYEKINPSTGKGCVVIFANASGHYIYITKNKVTGGTWTTVGVSFKTDAAGRAVISADFDQPSARILFFGVK